MFAIISSPDQDQTDKVTPVVGSVDKETQRVAMHLEGNDSLVVETGLYNLTNDEVPVLVHFGPDKQEQRTLIRLEKLADGDQQEESATTDATS